ncbi:MAG: coenzyme F420-0:L-glutamate ligase [Chloroflexi bacterium]|nr:coenzyme F420-0:L-glutamate ligase [Chloroflexota bacterium]
MSRSSFQVPSGISVIPIAGLPEIVQGDEIGLLIVDHARAAGVQVMDGDLIVVAQKVVSKAEGAVKRLSAQTPSVEAMKLADKVEKDNRLVQIILDQTARVVRAVPGVLIVETVHGYVCANAGVDQSNIDGEDIVTTLPEDSDRSARDIRRAIIDAIRGGGDAGRDSAIEIGVLVSDTFNRPWREGSTNVAIGTAGFDPLIDLRGTPDDFDREMLTSTVSLADEVASAAQLVMGESGRVPVAIVRGVRWVAGEFSIGRLHRPAKRDLFR